MRGALMRILLAVFTFSCVLIAACDIRVLGGAMMVFNKTGEDVVHVYADEYGLVGAYNRHGKVGEYLLQEKHTEN
jgi:hypothetical protein